MYLTNCATNLCQFDQNESNLKKKFAQSPHDLLKYFCTDGSHLKTDTDNHPSRVNLLFHLWGNVVTAARACK